MYVFGGFNSLLLSDILKYTPERCEAFDNETACLRAGPGIRCVWAATIPGCVPWEMATVQQQQKVFEDCPSRPGMRRPLSVSLSKSMEGYFPFQILSRGSCVLLQVGGCGFASVRALGRLTSTMGMLASLTPYLFIPPSSRETAGGGFKESCFISPSTVLPG